MSTRSSCTVREVGHYSCRSMTGNCKTLALLADEPGFVRMNPGTPRRAASKWRHRLDSTAAAARYTAVPTWSDRINKGTVYMTYQWWIGKCNELTIHKVDPVAYARGQVLRLPGRRHCRPGLGRGRSRASVHRAQAGCLTPPLPKTLSPAPPSSTTRPREPIGVVPFSFAIWAGRPVRSGRPSF